MFFYLEYKEYFSVFVAETNLITLDTIDPPGIKLSTFGAIRLILFFTIFFALHVTDFFRSLALSRHFLFVS